MEEETKSNAKCSTKPVSKKDSLVMFGMSLVFFALLIVRVEFVNRRAEVMETKLEKRIQRIEDEMQGKMGKYIVFLRRYSRQSETLRNKAQEILQTWVSIKQYTGRSCIALKNT